VGCCGLALAFAVGVAVDGHKAQAQESSQPTPGRKAKTLFDDPDPTLALTPGNSRPRPAKEGSAAPNPDPKNFEGVWWLQGYQYLLGPEWYESDGDHRWMPQRATLRMGAPPSAGMKLYMRGACAEDLLRAGPLPVKVTVNGIALPPAEIRPGETSFELSFPLPDSVVGKPDMHVTVESGRSFRPASDPRELGLAFGTFEVK